MRAFYGVVLFGLVACASAARADADKRITHKVKIDGETFRVTVVNKEDVYVASKSLVIMRTPGRHRKMHAAVRQATGCEVVDEMWENAKMIGVLDCSGKPPPDHPID